LLVPRWVVAFILRYVAHGDPTVATERDVDEYWAPYGSRDVIRAARLTLTEFAWTPLTADERRAMRVPITVILGTKDRVIRGNEAPARALASDVHIIEGGHCVNDERPDATYDIVSQALAQSRTTT
jgi:pimeloyl-ACP methyl ester carboxylesterase